MRAKNGRGEMPMDLARNEIVLTLLRSAAQELDRREEDNVRSCFGVEPLVLVYVSATIGS